MHDVYIAIAESSPLKERPAGHTLAAARGQHNPRTREGVHLTKMPYAPLRYDSREAQSEHDAAERQECALTLRLYEYHEYHVCRDVHLP